MKKQNVSEMQLLHTRFFGGAVFHTFALTYKHPHFTLQKTYVYHFTSHIPRQCSDLPFFLIRSQKQHSHAIFYLTHSRIILVYSNFQLRHSHPTVTFTKASLIFSILPHIFTHATITFEILPHTFAHFTSLVHTHYSHINKLFQILP